MFSRENHIVATEGYPFIGIALGLTVVGFLIHPVLFVVFGLLTLFVVYFFRNPKRRVPADEHLVVSPADGKVIGIETVEEGRFLKRKMNRVSVFMSPFNVHVNRVPVTGRIRQVAYNKGKFFAAFAEKASLANEQNAIVMENTKGDEVLFVQIAGWLARRIVCYAKAGEAWRQGAIFGMIRFGSRMDVYVPLEYEVKVKVGDKVRAGESVIAKIQNSKRKV